LEIARNFDQKPRMRDGYLSALAIDQAKAGQIAGARRVVESMDGNQSGAFVGIDGKMVNAHFERRWVLLYIAKAEAKAGKSAAVDTARALTLGPSRMDAGVVAVH
jgi:hypothetical protein